MTDYLADSRTALAALRALYIDKDADKATEITMMAESDQTYIAAMQALAMTFLKVIDRSAEVTGVTAANLIEHLSSQFAQADRIEA